MGFTTFDEIEGKHVLHGLKSSGAELQIASSHSIRGPVVLTPDISQSESRASSAQNSCMQRKSCTDPFFAPLRDDFRYTIIL
jgi:hypothetical protein